MREFTIYRDKWVRGDRYHNDYHLGRSALLNENDNMCCLGFLGKACGISQKRMLNKTAPDDVARNKHRNYPALSYDEWDKFVSINDNTSITNRQREDTLRSFFKNIGFKVSFKNTEKK